ncbi:hypothetical protein D3C86_1489230 [compost metagenome]
MRELGGMTEIFHLQHRLPFFARHFREGLGDCPTHHHCHHPLFGDVVDRPRADKYAVAQNGVVVRQLKNLVEFVRDKQDRFPVLLEALNDLIKLEDFVLRQGGGGLVEDHHLCLKRQGAGNGDHMALGDAQSFKCRSWVDLHLEAREDLLRPAVHLGPVELFEQALMQVLADKNVFGHRQLIEQHGFLMNRGYPDLVRRFRRREMNGDRFIKDFALFGLVNPGHHFDQRRFACAVFTNKGGNFAGPKLKLHVLKGAHTRENLGDALELQQRGGCGHESSPDNPLSPRERVRVRGRAA